MKKYIELARKLFKGSITQEEIDFILKDRSECRYANMSCEVCSAGCYKHILFVYLSYKEGILYCKDLEKDIKNISTLDLQLMLRWHEKINLEIFEQVNSIPGLIKIKQRENYQEVYKIHYLFRHCSTYQRLILDEQLIRNELRLRNNDSRSSRTEVSVWV